MIRPVDLYVTNGWCFEVQGLISPNFQLLEGTELKSGEVSVVDGKTNIKHKFSSQIKEFSDITLTRPYDGTSDDLAMIELQRKCIDLGFRFDGQLVKLHNGIEVFRILFLGCRIKNIAHPTMDTAAEERYDVKYTLSVSEWVEVR